jgi:hypothetical protein
MWVIVVSRILMDWEIVDSIQEQENSGGEEDTEQNDELTTSHS